MAKPFLALLLAALQFLSWSASPLYLCIGGDGSVCIDLGPGRCGDCRAEGREPADHSADSHACCSEHRRRDKASAGESTFESLASNECNCAHIQLFATQGPTIVRVAEALDVRPIECGYFDAALGGHLQITDSSTAGFEHRPPAPMTSLPLAVLATVVLRC